MNTPAYFKQEKSHTCSLAVLRMVLCASNVNKSEKEIESELLLITKTKLRNIPNIRVYELAKKNNLDVRIFDSLKKEEIINYLKRGNKLIQISIKLAKMYPGKQGLHSILLFALQGSDVIYHDPSYGESLVCNLEHLEKASKGVGKIIIYSKRR